MITNNDLTALFLAVDALAVYVVDEYRPTRLPSRPTALLSIVRYHNDDTRL